MDKRIKHSKERLTKAMFKCLKKYNLEEITVKMICDIADVNRSTFYAHYLSLNELYKDIEKEMVKFIVKDVDLIDETINELEKEFIKDQDI